MSRQVDTLGVDVLGVDILRPTQTIYNSAMPFAHWDPKKAMRFGSPSVNCFVLFFLILQVMLLGSSLHLLPPSLVLPSPSDVLSMEVELLSGE